MRLPAAFVALWTHRSFIAESVKREFHARYRGTQFGWLWAVLQPLAMIGVYTLIFTRLMRSTLPAHASPWAYSIYLCAGVLAWGLFAELLGRGVGLFVNHANLLKKVNLPRLALPLIAVLSALLNYAIVMALFFVFLLLIGAFPGAVVLLAVPVLAILVAFAVGLGLLGGVLNVFYRDIEHLLGIVLQFWFWLTPLVYVERALPERVAAILRWNPLWPLIDALHGIFLDARPPAWGSLLYPALCALLLLALATAAYRRLSTDLIDEL